MGKKPDTTDRLPMPSMPARVPALISDFFKIVMVMVFVLPLLLFLSTAFKTNGEIVAGGLSLFPKKVTLGNFEYILNDLHIDILFYLKNSVLIIVGVMVLQFFTMIPAAYAFAKHDFFYKGQLFALILVAFMMPVQVTFITTYLLLADWNLIGTLWPQILPAGVNAFGVFMMRQAFKQIPDEIIESARLDGSNEWKTMMVIALPIVKSTLLTIALFSFVGQWNAYFWPLVMTNSEHVRPLALIVRRIATANDGEGMLWGVAMASNLFLAAPIMVVYMILNKYILRSYGYKGVK